MTRRRPMAACLAFLGVIAVSGGVRAESTLTLSAAIDAALRQHEDPALAEARVVEAAALRRKALAALLPSLAFTGSYTRRAREVVRSFGGQNTVMQAENALGTALTLQSDVVDATNFPTLWAADHTLVATRAEAVEVRRALAFEVARAYLAVLTAERLAAVAGGRLAVARTNLALVQAQLQAGLARQLRGSRAELDVATAELAETRAASTVATARLALASLMGCEVVTAPLVVPPDSALPAGAPAVLVAEAEAVRPDLHALQSRVAAAGQSAREPRFRLIPSLGLAAQFRADNESGLRGEAWDWNVGLTLTWVLYDGGLRYAEAAARDAQLRALMLTGDRLRRRLATDIRQALVELDTSRGAVVLADRAVGIAELNQAEVQERVRQGVATAIELSDANLALFEAQTSREQQRLVLRLAELQLLQALGRFPDR